MPAAERAGDRIVLTTEYRDRDLIRAVPGARYDKDARTWSVALSWANCLCLRGVFGERLTIGDELRAWAAAEREGRVDPAMAARERALDPSNDAHAESPPSGWRDLYPYQRTGVQFLSAAGSAILADEMGAGKSAQTIVALEAQDAYPALIICPNSVKGSWAAEFARWAPHRSVQIVGGGAAKRRKQLELLENEECDSHRAIQAESTTLLTCAARAMSDSGARTTKGTESVSYRTVGVGRSDSLVGLNVSAPITFDESTTSQLRSTTTCSELKAGDALFVVATADSSWIIAITQDESGGFFASVATSPSPQQSATVRGSIASRCTCPPDVVVVNWEALRIHSRLAPYGSVRLSDAEKTPGELNRPWGAVVADEAHRAKEPKAKQTRALWAIGRSAEHRYALTGTPIANSPADLWAILNFVSPDEWPARTKYIDRYCMTSWNAFGGVDVVGIRPELRDEFFAVVDPRFLRRSKDIVLPWLPPKVHLTRRIELPAKQAKAYKELRDGMVAGLDSGTLLALDPLTLLGRLSQLASSYADVQPDGTVQLSEPSGKLDELDAILDELGDEPVVVFAASRQLIDLAAARLEKRGVTFGKITGTVSTDEREWAKEAFMAGRLQVLLLTLGAGSEGLTLTRARHLVFLQRSWSLVENRQAEDRIHRPGAEQHESVFIHDIVAAGTVEDDLLSALDAKGGMLEQIVRDKELLRKVLCGA